MAFSWDIGLKGMWRDRVRGRALGIPQAIVRAAWTLMADLDKLECEDTEGRAQTPRPTHWHPCSDFSMPPSP